MAERTFAHVKTMEYVDGVAHPKVVEYFDGENVEPVSPRATHAIVQFATLRILHRCAHDRGRALPEWDFYPTKDRGRAVKIVPDAAFVSSERLPRFRSAWPTVRYSSSTSIRTKERSPRTGMTELRYFAKDNDLLAKLFRGCSSK